MTQTPIGHHEIVNLIKLNINTSWYRKSFHFTDRYIKQPDGSLISDGSWDSENYITQQKSDWDRVFFNPLLKDNPSLQPLVDEFWDQARKNKYIESVAGTLFKDKINIEPLIPLVFNSSVSSLSNTERKDFIKRIVNLQPNIMNDLHSKLNNRKDFVLLSAYIDLLPKNIKQIKDTQESILNHLKDSVVLSESNIVKVLTVIMKSFEPSQEIYNFIKTTFAKKFETMHTLRDKFNQLEKKHFSQFKDEKKVNLFDNFGEYNHVIKISEPTLIDHFGVHKTNVTLVRNQIHNAMQTIAQDKIGKHLTFYTNTRGLHICSKNFEDKDKIEDLLGKIKEVLPNVIISLDYKQNHNPELNDILKKLNTSLMYFDLNDSLDKKEISQKRAAKI